MPSEDTLANYVQQISEQVDMEVAVDKAALQRLNLSDSIRVSAPACRLLKKREDGTRRVLRVVQDSMELDQAVALLALQMNENNPADAKDEVVAFMSGTTVLLTVLPKAQPAGGDKIAHSTGEIIVGYRCWVSNEMIGLLGDKYWPGESFWEENRNCFPVGDGAMGGGAF